ncbi:hypothetical protein Y1Q_0005534 [Alligator mississippiensis]|uniref:Uncharacterized protein n=1 Tax=Alligator mississippiensis TaxID=8496 RepID=A0A151MEW0_ALLMI|nr:hypothetical protein Y1Q_0005534 [Alligator mississippiensis]
MEYQQKVTKFLAQYYMNDTQPWSTYRKPLLHSEYYWGHLNREGKTLRLPHINPLKGKDYGDMTYKLLLTNLDSPGPATYLPTNTSCRETSVPAYTFGRKTPPRVAFSSPLQ